MELLNLEELHVFACTLSISAGEYLRDQALLRAQRGPAEAYDLELSIKENAADLVTKADMHAERMISDAIRQRYPEHKCVSFGLWLRCDGSSSAYSQDHWRRELFCWRREAVPFR